MRRFVAAALLFVLFLVAGYGYFKLSSPTAMVVIDELKETVVEEAAPAVTDVVVKEAQATPKKNVEQVSVNNLGMNSLWVYSTKDGSVVDILQVGSSPSAIQVSPNGYWIYVLNAGSKSISVIDAELFSVVKTLSIGEEPRTMRLSSSGDLLAIVTYSNKILFVDTKDFTQVGVVNTGKKPADAVFGNEGKYVFSVAEKSGLLEKFNPYLDHPIGVAEVGNNPVAIAILRNERAFVVNSGSDSVSVIDLIDLSRAKKYDVPVSSRPVAIVVDDDEKFAYVANKDSDSVTVFDVKSYKPMFEVIVGESPVTLQFNKFAEQKVVYVANSMSDDISVIDAVEQRELTRWKSGSRPSAMDLSPNGEFLFVAMKGRS